MNKRPVDPLTRMPLCLCLLFLLLSVLLTAAPTHALADTIKIAWPVRPATLDPHQTTDPWASTIIQACYQRLVELQGPAGRPVPAAAVTWRVSDDRLIYTFVLKKDMTFSDGRPLDAAAVSTSFNRAFHIGNNFFSCFPALKSIEIIGPYTFRFHLSRPDPSFLQALAGDAASIVSPNAALHAPSYLDRRTLGSGALEVADDQEDGTLVLTSRREDAKITRFSFLVQHDAHERAAMLKRGDVQIAADIDAKSLEDDEFLLKTLPGPDSVFLAFNLDRPWTGRKDARLALAEALDRQALMERIPGIGLTPESGYLPSGMWGYLKDAAAPAFDPVRARAALEKTGPPDAPLVLAFPAHNRLLADMAPYIKEALAEIGLSVDFKSLDLDKQAAPIWDYDLYLRDNRPSVSTPEHFWEPLIGLEDNLCRYRNENLTAKRRTASLAADLDQRLAAIYDIQRLLVQDLPYLLLVTRQVSYGLNKQVEGVALASQRPECIMLPGLKRVAPKSQ